MSMKLAAPSYLNRLLRTIENAGKGKSVLNVGCGDGEYDIRLGGRFGNSVGIDIDRNDIYKASGRAAKSSFALADGCAMPFMDSSFEKVVCVDVIEHVRDDAGLLGELSRVVKRGGEVVLTFPNRSFPFTYDPVNAVLGSVSKAGTHLPIGIWGFGHLRIYGMGEIRALLEKNGFSVVKTEYLNHYLSGLLENYMSTILSGFLKSPSGRNRVGAGKGGKGSARGSHLSGLFSWLAGRIIDADERLFGASKTSIGILVKAVKR
jgi:SAM-dependent methyltransferase